MRRVCGSVLISAIVVFAASAAPAPQAPPLLGAARGILSHLSNSQVREELKLTEDQLKKLEELKAERALKRSQTAAALRGLSLEERGKKRQEQAKSTESALAKILTPKQLRRAEQILLQRFPPILTLRRSEVIAALKLTGEQKKKMDLVMKGWVEELRVGRANGGLTYEQRIMLNKRCDEELVNVLTPAQKKRWKQLLGEPFKWEPRPLGEKE